MTAERALDCMPLVRRFIEGGYYKFMSLSEYLKTFSPLGVLEDGEARPVPPDGQMRLDI